MLNPSDLRANITSSNISIGRLLFSINSRLILINARSFIKSKFPHVYSKQLELRQDNGLSGDYQWLRLFELYNLIAKYNISSAMEFGSGGSTVLLDSLNLRRVDTFEQNKYYHDKTVNCLLGNNRTEVHLSKSSFDFDGKHYYSRFSSDLILSLSATYQHELLYVDGPTSRVDPDKSTMSINMDTADILNAGFRPKVILIDSRPETTAYLFDRFSEEYFCSLRTSYLPIASKYSSKYTYHSFLLRKDLV